jgi:hypothetical protein
MSNVDFSPFKAVDVLDFVSRYLDQDSCISEVNWCANCFRLKDYLKVITMELKSVQQIIRILYEDRINADNPQNQDNLSNQIHKDAEVNKMTKLRTNSVNYTNEKIGKKNKKTAVMGDSHARGLAKELKYRLNHELEIRGIKKPGSTLLKLVKTTCSDLKTLTKRGVCLVWGDTNDVGRNETNMGIHMLNDFISSHEHANIIVLNVSYRHDFVPNSYVNYEAKVLNRKLGRQKGA